MQQVVSASIGTTATGRPRSSGRSCCSTEAKKAFMSRNSHCTGTAVDFLLLGSAEIVADVY